MIICLLIVKHFFKSEPRKDVMLRKNQNLIGKSKNHWYPTNYGYDWAGGWLMAGEGRKQVLYGYLHAGGSNE